MPADNEAMPIDAIRGTASLGADAVSAALKSAAETTGAQFRTLYAMARRESALDPNAKAATSSAAGLFQFIEQTWLAAVKTYGGRHGLHEAAADIVEGPGGKFAVADPARREAILNLRFDPQKAAALAGELVNENRAGLERRLGRAVDDAEIYAAHFLGLAGAVRLLSAAPETEAAALVPQAAAANKAVFYAQGRAKTVGEVIASIARTMNIEAPGAPTPPLETKSAVAIGRLAHPERLAPAPLAGSPAPSFAHEDERRLPSLAELFALRPSALLSSPPSLSALTFTALSALDPRALRKDDER